MADDRLSQIYEERMGPNVGAAALAYLGSQYEELKVPNSAARNKLADFLDKQPAQLKEKICVLPIKMAAVVERMKNPQDITEADADTMQKHQYMYADIHQVIDREDFSIHSTLKGKDQVPYQMAPIIREAVHITESRRKAVR